eukprot:5802537-Ditylum_brightwellii.AAC.1
MSLCYFRQIRSAFHPDTESSAIGNKCHQLRFLIQKINRAAIKTCYIGPKLALDESGHQALICCSCGCISRKNVGNIDVDDKAKHLSSTMKDVVNVCIASGIANDPIGTCQKNRKGFPGKNECLIIRHGADIGDFKRLYNRCFCMVTTRWKG